jgi:hypothetical protein
MGPRTAIIPRHAATYVVALSVTKIEYASGMEEYTYEPELDSCGHVGLEL